MEFCHVTKYNILGSEGPRGLPGIQGERGLSGN